MALRLLWSEVLGLEQKRGDRCPCTLSIVTHLSDDRLHQLNGLCEALAPDDTGSREAANTGAITVCVAILVEDRKGSDRVLHAVRALRHGKGQLIIRVRCFARAPPLCDNFRRTTRGPPKPSWYPINQLRNRAMALAETDLVLICDVDFRPCQRLARLARASDTAALGLLKRASCRLTCIVLPAFEILVPGDDDTREYDVCTTDKWRPRQKEATEMPDKSFWSRTLSSKVRLLQVWAQGHRASRSEPDVVPFASQVWPQGHRATDFDRWKEASAPYEVAYEEGFEPFVIMNRLLVPAFDERFDGYGRNKVIFFYRLHALGFSFTVEPDLFLVHAPHARSESWRRTFGRQARAAASPQAAGVQSERFTSILEQYRSAKAEIDAEALNKRQPARGFHRADMARRLLLGSSNRARLGFWSMGGATRLKELGGAFRTCSHVMEDAMRHALFSSMHALWYEYHPKGVDVVARLESRLGRGDSEITIFTQCSLSRLGRLERMCSRWTGVISAAVIADGGGCIDRNMRRQVSALHTRVESGGKCRLDISLCQDAPGVTAGDGLYPVNSLRNVALRAARTDLVLSLDIDSLPMAGLHEVVSSPTAYDRLLQLCRGGNSPSESDAGCEQAAPPTFVVVPALEFVGASSPDDPRIQAILRETDNIKRKAADLILSGEVQAFHSGCFPEGHRQTNLDRWVGLDADAAPYNVKYAEGYEPYGLFFRRQAPPFDERFRGFGLDKVSHCWHLHRLGWSFRALPAAFVVDLPHPSTKHRSKHRTNPSFRASVDGLFKRFMFEIDHPTVAAGPSLSSSAPNPAKHSSGAKVPGYQNQKDQSVVYDAQPRDYEVLADLSLLVWGDAWVAAGTHQQVSGDTLTRYCGGGWNLKGSTGAWSGLRFGSSSSSYDGDPAGAHRDKVERGSKAEHCAAPAASNRVAIPPRMVGGWADVCLGGGEGDDGFGLHGRSAIRPDTLHGVMRYWIHPRWDQNKSLRGKLPGLGMSGDVRFFVRWHSGCVGYCCLMTLGRPLKDICEVHVVRQTPFSLERDRTTAIQLEADMRRSPDNGGALSFRAWADGSVVYEARVYASDSVVSGGQRKGMRVEDAFVHVLSRSGGDEGEEKGASAAAQHVLVGGVEVWGRRPAEKVDERVEEPSLVDAGGGDGAEDGASFPSDVAPMASTTEQLRFVFVASTGRCGTHFLSQLLATAPGVVAFHEAAPELNGHDTLLAAATAPEESYAKRRHKATGMLRSARRLSLVRNGSQRQAQEGESPGPLTYVETSHLFLKTYADVVMRELAPFFEIVVIVLRRDSAASLKSRIELGHLCGRNKRSDWLLVPPRNDLKPFAASATSSGHSYQDGPSEDAQEVNMDGFEALMAYADYTEANIRAFRACYEQKERDATSDIDNRKTACRRGTPLPHPPPPAEPRLSPTPPPPATPGASCNVVETSLESLQTEQGVRRLFADLKLVVSEERTWRVVEGGATNTRDGEKRRTVPLEYCRQRIISASPKTIHHSQEA